MDCSVTDIVLLWGSPAYAVNRHPTRCNMLINCLNIFVTSRFTHIKSVEIDNTFNYACTALVYRFMWPNAYYFSFVKRLKCDRNDIAQPFYTRRHLGGTHDLLIWLVSSCHLHRVWSMIYYVMVSQEAPRYLKGMIDGISEVVWYRAFPTIPYFITCTSYFVHFVHLYHLRIIFEFQIKSI